MSEETTLADELGEAFDEANQAEDNVEPKETEIEASPETIEEAPPEDEYRPPEHWGKGWVEYFDKIGGLNSLSSIDAKALEAAGIELPDVRALQEGLVGFHNELHDKHSDSMQSLATERRQFEASQREWDQFNGMIADYMPYWQQQGMGWQQGLGQMFAWADRLAEDPQGAIMDLAQQYQVDLNQALEEAPFIPDEVRALQGEVRELRGQLGQQDQRRAQQQDQALFKQLEDFRSAADEQGSLKHPHFDKVHQRMAQLITGGAANGLDDAYQMACQLDPEIQAERQKQLDAERAEALKQKAEKATAASRNITSSNSSPKPPKGSFRDDINEQLAAQGFN